MMLINMIILIYFVGRMMKVIISCAQAVMIVLLPTLPNHADLLIVPTVSRKITAKYLVSINSRSAEPTRDTENECATSRGQSDAPGG